MHGQHESAHSARLQVAVDFLKRVLPQEGFKCAYVVDGARKFNVFFDTIENLALFVLQQDDLGKTVYHACSTFRSSAKDPRGTSAAAKRLGRTQHNVLASQALWVDVDCGEGKPYPTQRAGAVHVAAFCRTTGLPAPLYVGSGNGLHLYWPLAEALDAPTWRRYAAGLAQLFNHYGLHVDTTRTKDLSSVLRTPGTHHRKNGVRPVQVGDLVGPYPLQLFERLLDGNVQGLHVLPRAGAQPSVLVQPLRPQRREGAGTAADLLGGTANKVLPGVRSALDQRALGGLSATAGGTRTNAGADLLGGLYEDQPSSGEVAARLCGQLARLREDPGSVTEPLWHAALGVMAHCDDGRATSHSWSDPEWHGAIDEKLERLAGFGPTTCAKFASLDAGGCVGCKYSGRITSPIQLGRDGSRSGPAEANGATAGAALQVEGTSGPNGFGFGAPSHSAGGEVLPTPPADFIYDALGRLQHETGAKNGGVSYDLVCASPLYLKAIQTLETDRDRVGLVFRAKRPREAWRDVVVTPRKALGRDSGTELADRGVTIHDGELWRKYVRNAMDFWERENDVETRYDQFGWKDGETSFLVGKRLYTPTEVQAATGSPTLEQRAQYLSIQSKKGASLERWQKAANKLFAAGLEHQSLAVLCGFAAPLMRFHAEGEGGAIVSFVSDRTASGKTTALEAAASIWGQHKGLKLDETDTRVAKGLKLGVLGNLPCTFDELHERDPEMIRQFVLIFTNGTDKDRGTLEGELKANKAEWQTILLTASNASLVDILSNMNASDAPAARILEFTTELPPHVQKEDFEEIRRELNFNHGFAGDAYMKKLVQPEIVAWIRTNIPMWSAMIREAAGLTEKHRFWVRLVVSIIAAGKIVEGMGLLEFSMDRITRWLIDYVSQGAASIRGASPNDAASALAAAMSEFYLDTLIVPNEYKHGHRSAILRAPSRQLLVRYEVENKRLFLSETALKKWLVKSGVNARHFFDTLKKQGVVLGEVRKVTLGAGTDLASGQTPSVTINMANPLVSGVVASLEEALPPPKEKTRAERIREFSR